MFILLIFFTFYNLSAIEKHVIGSRPAGFFSNFLGVLNHLNWCNKTNTEPVVYWDNQNLYYVPGYSRSENVWEYYFEQTSIFNYQFPDRIDNNYAAPDGSRLPLQKEYKKNFSPDLRKRMHYLITKFIHIKPKILEKITSFYTKNLKGKKTVGLHIRGTDKFTEVRPVALKKFIETTKKYSGYQFFVATDEAHILQKMKLNLPGKVIYYDAYRSDSNKPIHHRNRALRGEEGNRALRGEEVLIEAILLSCCNIFIHSISNVSTAVLFFNPDLPNIFLE
ncbi:MAG: hypothetical protein WDZ41_03560 [Candidatus Babeliales bacterium]